MSIAHPGTHQKSTFMRSHALKLLLLWTLFALAVIGTYMLSHKVQLRSLNYAAVFMASSSSHEVALYADRAEPSSVEAAPGDEIVFVVKDAGVHDMAEERTQRRDARLESGDITIDESYSLVFQGKGAFSFYDRHNQDIRVAITIQ